MDVWFSAHPAHRTVLRSLHGLHGTLELPVPRQEEFGNNAEPMSTISRRHFLSSAAALSLARLGWKTAEANEAFLGESRYPFAVEVERSGFGHIIVAKNRGPAPISVRVQIYETHNVGTTDIFPVFAVIRPKQEIPVARLYPANKNEGYGFKTQSKFMVGNYYALHDVSARYRLPFQDGLSFPISQAPGGKISTHNTPDNAHAIDFVMPQYTPLVAARDGVVIEVQNDHLLGGKDRSLLSQANYIRILHADETFATYAHLATGGARVQPGQFISAGTLIGLSGATGYASGPHLHFVVQTLQRTQEGFQAKSVPVRFYVGTPPYIFEPEYQQMVTADYKNPGRPPLLLKPGSF